MSVLSAVAIALILAGTLPTLSDVGLTPPGDEEWQPRPDDSGPR